MFVHELYTSHSVVPTVYSRPSAGEIGLGRLLLSLSMHRRLCGWTVQPRRSKEGSSPETNEKCIESRCLNIWVSCKVICLDWPCLFLRECVTKKGNFKFLKPVFHLAIFFKNNKFSANDSRYEFILYRRKVH